MSEINVGIIFSRNWIGPNTNYELWVIEIRVMNNRIRHLELDLWCFICPTRTCYHFTFYLCFQIYSRISSFGHGLKINICYYNDHICLLVDISVFYHMGSSNWAIKFKCTGISPTFPCFSKNKKTHNKKINCQSTSTSSRKSKEIQWETTGNFIFNLKYIVSISFMVLDARN